MDVASSKLPVWCIAFVLISVHVYVAEGRNGSSNPCIDGTYSDSGRICCLCNTGHYVKEHCTTDLQYGKCERCASNTYSSQPSNMDSCEPCTSCSQPNANLEVKEPCTSGVDTKCKCKKDHYCSSGTETCRICNPCKECPEGVKVACSAHNNTVCNDKIEGVNNNGVIIGSIVGSLCVLIPLTAWCIWKCYRKRNQTSGQRTNAADAEMQNLTVDPDVDLHPHLPAIARAIGWKCMRDVATCSGISQNSIDSCQLDHPNDSAEQTFQLLKIWREDQGREASKKLIQSLENSGYKATADEVKKILHSS